MYALHALFLAFPLAGVTFALRASNWSGRIIVLVLFVGSIFAWSVMLTKIKELREARMMSRRFLQAYRKEGHPAALFIRRQRFDSSPLNEIYQKACAGLGAAFESRGVDPNDLFMGAVGGHRTPPERDPGEWRAQRLRADDGRSSLAA